VIISQHDHLYIFFRITCKKTLAIYTCTIYTLYYKLNRGVHADANAIYNMQQNANITFRYLHLHDVFTNRIRTDVVIIKYGYYVLSTY
jgi:hypothetical protein